MPATKTDGGPAFPASVTEILGVATNSAEFALPGMSLRDYFAAHAPVSEALLQAAAEVASDQKVERYGDAWCRVMAAHAYRYADAMLAERSQP